MAELNKVEDDLSQLKWIFDGKKVTQTQLTEKMKEAIKEWDIPDDILRKWGNLGYSETKLKKEILNIFKAE